MAVEVGTLLIQNNKCLKVTRSANITTCIGYLAAIEWQNCTARCDRRRNEKPHHFEVTSALNLALHTELDKRYSEQVG